MDLDYKLLGKRMKELRLKKHMTQENLAKRIGVTTVYISHLEVGSSKPSVETLLKVCIELDTTVEYLLIGSIIDAEESLSRQIAVLLKECSSKKLELIYHMIKVIIDHSDIN